MSHQQPSVQKGDLTKIRVPESDFDPRITLLTVPSDPPHKDKKKGKPKFNIKDYIALPGVIYIQYEGRGPSGFNPKRKYDTVPGILLVTLTDLVSGDFSIDVPVDYVNIPPFKKRSKKPTKKAAK